MSEDKQRTCDALAEALRTTRQFSDLVRLDYVKDDDFEVVIPVYENGRSNSINVHLDSCWALIKDVVKHL